MCVCACAPEGNFQEEDAIGKMVGSQQCCLHIGGLRKLFAVRQFLLTNCEVQGNPRSDIWQAEEVLFLTASKISPGDIIKVNFNSS